MYVLTRWHTPVVSTSWEPRQKEGRREANLFPWWRKQRGSLFANIQCAIPNLPGTRDGLCDSSEASSESEARGTDFTVKLTFWPGHGSHPGWRNANRRWGDHFSHSSSRLIGASQSHSRSCAWSALTCLLQDYQKESLTALLQNLLHNLS